MLRKHSICMRALMRCVGLAARAIDFESQGALLVWQAA